MNNKPEFNYSTLIETVFAVVIGQNAIMLSKPIISYLAETISFLSFISLFFIGCINLLTLIANWMSSKKTEDFYNKTLFLEDIGTLAIFAIFTQVISDSFTSNGLLLGTDSWLLVFSISYLLIYFSFVLWNSATLPHGNQSEKAMAIVSIKLNLVIMVALLLLLISIVFNSSRKLLLFAINIILQISVLIYYFYAVLMPSKTYRNVKIKAEWIRSNLLLKQFLVSILSYVIRPFIHEKENAVKNYWTNYYGGSITDDLVFDGEYSHYFDKVSFIGSIFKDQKLEFIDLCSGNGAFHNWLIENKIPYGKYLGMDFAVDNNHISNNASIVKDNILEATYSCDKNTVIFISNGLCYLKNDELEKLLAAIDSAGMIIVIEPVPSVFWDATFSGILLNYRTKKTLENLALFHNYNLELSVTDYLIKIGGLYCFALSRLYVFKK